MLNKYQKRVHLDACISQWYQAYRGRSDAPLRGFLSERGVTKGREAVSPSSSFAPREMPPPLAYSVIRPYTLRYRIGRRAREYEFSRSTQAGKRICGNGQKGNSRRPVKKILW